MKEVNEFSFDKQNMRQVLLDFPRQLEFNPRIKEIQEIEKAILAGMGGSALPGRLANCIIGKKVVEIHNDYGLPKTADENTLVIACSYSGNTEETLDSLAKALERKCKVVCVSSGGELEKIAFEKKLPIVKIPSGLQPRMASGFATAAVLNILSAAKICKDYTNEFHEAKITLEEEKTSIEKKGKELAEAISDHVPIIYASEANEVVAFVAKIKFNENSKTPAFYNVFPELNHNEMNGFTNSPASFHFFFLEDDSDNEAVKKRMKITKELLEERKLALGI